MTTLNSGTWQKFRAGILATAAEADQPCWICRQPIDYTLRGRQPAAPSLDHLVPRFLGGELLDPANVIPCHFGCNSRRGAVQRNRTRSTQSRRW